MIHKHKYLTLDAIRGVAAIFVFTQHAGQLFGGWQFLHAYLAVDLFFVMSGFVISVAYDESLLSKKLSVVDFLKIRAIRLYPLYFLALFLSVMLTINHARHDISPFDWSGFSIQIILGLMLIPSLFSGDKLFPLNGPSWSIFFEVLANFFYAKCRPYLSNKTLGFILAISAVALIILVCKNHSMNFGYEWVNWIGGLPRVLYSFAAGVLIYRVRESLTLKKKFNNFLSLLILLIVMLILGLPIANYTEIYELIVVLLLFPMLVFIATYVEPHKNEKLGKIYATLGFTSYAIYILQAPIVYAYSAVFLKHGHTSMLQGFIVLFLLFCISLVLDMFYDQPVRRWMRGYFSGKSKV